MFWLHPLRIRFSVQIFGVVKCFQPTKIPSPRVLAISHKTLIAYTVNRGV